jgi:hypothetical protein
MKLVGLCVAAAMVVSCGADKKDKADVDRQAGVIGVPTLGVRNACTSNSQLSLSSTQKSSEIYHYSFKNIPVCSWYGRTLNFDSDTGVFSGHLEGKLESLVIDEDVEWPESKLVEAFMVQTSGLDSFNDISSSRCWYLTPELELLPVYDVTIRAKQHTIKALANDSEIFEIGNGGFDLSRISYQVEGVGPQVDVLETNSLDGSGLLSGRNFAIFTGDGSPRAFSADGNFEISESDRRFAQASAYANAELMLGWFEKLTSNSVDSECFPIDVKLHHVFSGGFVNNARYQPDVSTVSGRPEILIGNGDGIRLTNLATDPDVIAHEFAHHIIYRGVKDTLHFESVVIHEGLADFFVFSKSGNACLAETVCPLGSFDCVQPKCLRTGDNNLSFADQKISSTPHGQGQIISGMLLDLVDLVATKTEVQYVSTIAASINYLLPRSDLGDFVQALMLADRDVNEGKFACDIYQLATDRGLGERIGQLKCADFQK